MLVDRQLVEKFQKDYPDLYEAVYPHNISHSDEWPSPKFLLGTALDVVIQAAADFNITGETNVVAQWVYAATAKLVQLGVPTYFLHRPVTEALIHTDLPQDTRLTDLRWPLDAVLFVLPRGAVQSHHGNVMFVVAAKVAAYEPLKICSSERNATTFKRNAYLTFCVTEEDQVYAWGHPGEEGSITAFETDPVLDNFLWEGRAPTTDQDRRINKLHCRLALQCMLVMSARPDFVTEARIIQPSKPVRHGPPKRDLWSPRFLGSRFVIQRERQSLGGTHASPEPGWRRGHWRLYRMAEGKPWRRDFDQWIFPTYILP